MKRRAFLSMLTATKDQPQHIIIFMWPCLCEKPVKTTDLLGIVRCNECNGAIPKDKR